MEPPQVNHEQYEEILREHQMMRSLLQQTSALLASRADSLQPVVRLLQQLNEHAVKHFAHEEEGGYFQEAIAAAPRLANRAEQLEQQHPALAAALAGLLAQAEEGDGSEQCWQALTYRFEDLAQRLRQHEANENKLVQEAFNTDIGAED